MEWKYKAVIRIDEITPSGLTSENRIFTAQDPIELYLKAENFLCEEQIKANQREAINRISDIQRKRRKRLRQ